MFGETSESGAQALDVSPVDFRQLLSRARQDLYQFMNNKCGLVLSGYQAKQLVFHVSASFLRVVVDPRAQKGCHIRAKSPIAQVIM